MAGRQDDALELLALRFLNQDQIGSGCRYLCSSGLPDGLHPKGDEGDGIDSAGESGGEYGGHGCVSVSGPFGRRPLLYFDFAATGRPLKSVEKALYKQLLPNVANTHTHQSALGRQATFFLHEARQIGKEFFNAGHEDGLYFCGSGASAAAAKFLQLLLVSAPHVAREIHSRSSRHSEGNLQNVDSASVAAAAFALLSGCDAQSAAAALAGEGGRAPGVGQSYVQAFGEAFEEDRWHSFRCMQCKTRLKTPLHARRHLYEHAALNIHRRFLEKLEGRGEERPSHFPPRPAKSYHLHVVFLCDASSHHSSFLPFRAVASSLGGRSSSFGDPDEKALAAAACLSGAFCFPRQEASVETGPVPEAASDVSYGFRFLPLNARTGGLCLRGLNEALQSISESCASFNAQARNSFTARQKQEEDSPSQTPCGQRRQCSCEKRNSNSRAAIHLCCFKSFKAFFNSLFRKLQTSRGGGDTTPEVCVVPVCILSAASNVTGTLLANPENGDSAEECNEGERFQTCLSTICSAVHAFGGIVAVDCAAATAHIRLDFNPILSQRALEKMQRQNASLSVPLGADFEHPWRCGPKQAAAPDAFFVSTHKLLGGTGAAGVLLVKKRLLLADSPAHPAGGTVFLVNAKWRQEGLPEQQQGSVHCVYAMDRSETREEGGSPNLAAICRAALALRTLQSMPLAKLREREAKLVRQLIRVWQAHPRIHLVGSAVAPRVGIISFLIKYGNTTAEEADTSCSENWNVGERRNGGLYLHPNFVVRLLSDLFGIQCRSGCLCAGPFTAFSLQLSEDVVAATETLLLLTGQELLRPGVVRVSVSLALTKAQLQQLLLAVLWVATHGFKMLHCYSVDPETGDWHPTREAIAWAASARGAVDAGVENGGASDDSHRVWLSDCVPSLDQRFCISDSSDRTPMTAWLTATRGDPAEDILCFANAVLSGVLRRSSVKGVEAVKLSAPPLPLHLPCTSPVAFRFPRVQRRPRLAPEKEAVSAVALESRAHDCSVSDSATEGQSPAADAYFAQMRQSVASLVWFALPADGLESVHSWRGPRDRAEPPTRRDATLKRFETLARVGQGQRGAKVRQLLSLLSRSGEEALRPLVSGHAVRWVESSTQEQIRRASHGPSSTRNADTPNRAFDEMQHLRALDSVFEPRRFEGDIVHECTCKAVLLEEMCVNCRELLAAVDTVMANDDAWGCSDSKDVCKHISTKEQPHAFKISAVPRSASAQTAEIKNTVQQTRNSPSARVSKKMLQRLPLPETASSSETEAGLRVTLREPARALTNAVLNDERSGLSKVPLLPVPRQLRRTFGQALHAFKMLRPGDRLLLGLSGGKDSLTLLHLLRDLQRRAPFSFALAAATVDPMTPSYDPAPLGPYLQSLDSDVDSSTHACGSYLAFAQHNFNVLVLGQHLDDLAESFIMSAFHNGALNTMKAHYVIGAGKLRVVRPLVYTREADLQSFAEGANLPIIKDNCPACFAHPKERHRVKLLLSEQEREFPNLFSNIQKTLLPLMAINCATHSIRTGDDGPADSPNGDSTRSQNFQYRGHAGSPDTEEAEDDQALKLLETLSIKTSDIDYVEDVSLAEVVSAVGTNLMEACDEAAVLSLTACGPDAKACAKGQT